MRIEGLVFAGIATGDVAGMAAFFRGVLGVETSDEGEWQRVPFPDGTSLALVPRDWVSPPSDTNLGLLVDDVEAATAELAARGVAPDGELASAGGLRYRHFRAPDGRVFELVDRRG